MTNLMKDSELRHELQYGMGLCEYNEADQSYGTLSDESVDALMQAIQAHYQPQAMGDADINALADKVLYSTYIQQISLLQIPGTGRLYNWEHWPELYEGLNKLAPKKRKATP